MNSGELKRFARHSPLGLGMYAYPKLEGRNFYCRNLRTSSRINKALLRLFDPSDTVDTLVLSMPPRCGKSFLISKLTPAWLAGEKGYNVLNTGYSKNLVDSFGANAQEIMNDHGEALWKKSVDQTQRAKSFWKLLGDGGSVMSASILGQITGFGFHHATVDDPYSNYADAHSETIRRKVWAAIGSVVDTRMEEPIGGRSTTAIVQTRWHMDDVAGRYVQMAEDGDDSILCIRLPAIADQDLFDEDGKLFAAEGELLFEWQWPREKLDKWVRRHGRYMFDALFQGIPTTPEDVFWEASLFEGDIRFDKWPAYDWMVLSFDPAHGDEVVKGCDSAIVAGAFSVQHNTFYLDADLEPSGPERTVDRAEAFVDKLYAETQRLPDAMVVEAIGLQGMITKKLEEMCKRRGWNQIQLFNQDINRDLGEEAGTTRNKNMKIQTLDPYFRDRQVKFKAASPGAGRLLTQAKVYGASSNLVDGLDAMEILTQFYDQVFIDGILGPPKSAK